MYVYSDNRDLSALWSSSFVSGNRDVSFHRVKIDLKLSHVVDLKSESFNCRLRVAMKALGF